MNKKYSGHPQHFCSKQAVHFRLSPHSERQVWRGRIPDMSTELGVPELFRHATAIGDSFSFPFLPERHYLGIKWNTFFSIPNTFDHRRQIARPSIIQPHSLDQMWSSDILDASLKAPESLTFQAE